MEKKMKAIIDLSQEKVPDKGKALLRITIENRYSGLQSIKKITKEILEKINN